MPLVVTVTSRLPTLALEATVMLAVNCVRVTPEIKFTLTPEPKLTVEKPAWKVVNSPYDDHIGRGARLGEVRALRRAVAVRRPVR